LSNFSLDEIIDEAIRANPGASLDQISEGIVEFIQSSLAPIIHSMKLARAATPIELRSSEFRIERLSASSRELTKEKRELKGRQIQELAWLKFQLNGTIAPAPLIPTIMTNEDRFEQPRIEYSYQTTLDRNRQRKLGVSDLVLGKTNHNPALISPYTKFASNPLEEDTFRLGKALQWRLSQNPKLVSLVQKIETSSRSYTLEHNLDWTFELNETADVESPLWRKTVLIIHPKNSEFEESMRLWDELDKKIRYELGNSKDADRVAEFNKTFFIEMDLR